MALSNSVAQIVVRAQVLKRFGTVAAVGAILASSIAGAAKLTSTREQVAVVERLLATKTQALSSVTAEYKQLSSRAVDLSEASDRIQVALRKTEEALAANTLQVANAETDYHEMQEAYVLLGRAVSDQKASLRILRDVLQGKVPLASNEVLSRFLVALVRPRLEVWDNSKMIDHAEFLAGYHMTVAAQLLSDRNLESRVARARLLNILAGRATKRDLDEIRELRALPDAEEGVRLGLRQLAFKHLEAAEVVAPGDPFVLGSLGLAHYRFAANRVNDGDNGRVSWDQHMRLAMDKTGLAAVLDQRAAAANENWLPIYTKVVRAYLDKTNNFDEILQRISSETCISEPGRKLCATLVAGAHIRVGKGPDQMQTKAKLVCRGEQLDKDNPTARSLCTAWKNFLPVGWQ